jgi:hypothetical protein
VRALGLDQPWASLIAAGIKTIETRDWSTTYRGPLAIHANKGWTQAQHDRWLEFSDEFGPSRFPPLPEWKPPRRRQPTDLPPLGCVVAMATVHDVGRFEPDVDRAKIGEHGFSPFGALTRLRFLSGGVMGVSDADESTGDTSPDRYGWVLRAVYRLDSPYPLKGQQGLWTPELPERMALSSAPGTWAHTCPECGQHHPEDACQPQPEDDPTPQDTRPQSFDP